MLETYRTGADKLIERTKDDPEWVELGKLSNKQNRSEKENERYWALSDSVFNKYRDIAPGKTLMPIMGETNPNKIKQQYADRLALYGGENIPALEKDFANKKQLYEKNLKALKGNYGAVGYEHYPGGLYASKPSNMSSALGRFRYETLPSGEKVILDNYDFYNDVRKDDVEAYEKMGRLEKAATVAKESLMNPLAIPSILGNAYIGRDGRPVRIQYDPATLNENGMNYRQGGLTDLARHVQSKGRGEDKMLVHMTPKEVEGLQAIARAHGGSLSINPDTGLVEAGFLKNMLPMIAGAALTATGVGAPMAALMVGGGTALATGDINQGLMAGLGAYGGAGLASGLSEAGAAATTATNTAGTTTGTGISAAPSAEGFTPYEQALGSSSQTAAPAEWMAQQPTQSTADAMKTLGNSGVTVGGPPQAPVTLGNMWRGIGQLGTEAGRSAVYDALPKYTLPAAGAAVAGSMIPDQPEPETYDGPLKKYRLSQNFQGYTPPTPNPYYRPTGYAQGGIAAMAPGGIAGTEPSMYPQSMMDKTQYATPTQMPTSAEVVAADYEPKVNPYTGEEQFYAGGSTTKKPSKAQLTSARSIAIMDPYEASMAELNNARYDANMSQAALPKSGIAQIGQLPYTVTAAQGGQLGGYSDGGRMLKGPGDGMSDSIPASIGGRQPARLADGEFVVPADVVSHLGNGSTDAGAKKLYAMMDKVRMARTGKKAQAPAVKTGKYLPA